jgi:transposase
VCNEEKTTTQVYPEFKLEAASLQMDQGYTYKQACEPLDLTETALRGWVKQLEAELGGSTPKSAALTAEQKRIQGLKARVNRLERWKSILRKATALLMSDEFNRKP